MTSTASNAAGAETVVPIHGMWISAIPSAASTRSSCWTRGLGAAGVALSTSSRPGTRTSTEGGHEGRLRNPKRPPLLLLTGTEDRICPPSVNSANLKKQRKAPSATAAKEYLGRCHFPGQDGWEQVADDALAWTVEQARSWRTSAAAA